MAADVEGGIVYTVAAPSDALWPAEAMFASRWRDGRALVDVDSINLQRSTGDLALELARRVTYMADESGRISWRSFDPAAGRIRLQGRVAAFEGGPARLALGRPTTPRLSAEALPASTLLAVSSRSGLHLLEIRESGEPTARGSADLPPLETVRRLAFHPSGHYLYTSGEGEGLRIFRVEEDDTLHETARETQGGGEIVVTASRS